MQIESSRYVLYNARIYTMDEREPVVAALVIEGGKIFRYGDQDTIMSQFKDSSTHINLGGRTIIPGLIDAHIHLQHYALSLQRVECETSTRGDCIKNVYHQVAGSAAGDWILGHGWNQNEWPEGFGDAILLDQVAPENPVYLTAKSLHAAWVNSIALSKAAITAQTADPPGGQIQRQPDGSPTGILFETAMSLVSDIIPQPSINHVAQVYRRSTNYPVETGYHGCTRF